MPPEPARLPGPPLRRWAGMPPCLAVLYGVAALGVAGQLGAQAPRSRLDPAAQAASAPFRPRSLQVFAGAGAIDISPEKRWAIGPSLGIRWTLGRRVSVDADAATMVIHLGDDEFKGGVYGNVGPSWVWRGPTTDVAVSVGASLGTLWEESGGQASSVGVFAGAGLTRWLGRSVGVTARARYHLWWGDPGFTFNAGLAIRL